MALQIFSFCFGGHKIEISTKPPLIKAHYSLAYFIIQDSNHLVLRVKNPLLGTYARLCSNMTCYSV